MPVGLKTLLRDDEMHFIALAKHFFRGFFENDFVSRGSETRLTVVNALALLAMPPILYTLYLINLYSDVGWFFPRQFAAVSLVDHCRYVTFTMIVIGFVAILGVVRVLSRPPGLRHLDASPSAGRDHLRGENCRPAGFSFALYRGCGGRSDPSLPAGGNHGIAGIARFVSASRRDGGGARGGGFERQRLYVSVLCGRRGPAHQLA